MVWPLCAGGMEQPVNHALKHDSTMIPRMSAPDFGSQLFKGTIVNMGSGLASAVVRAAG